LKIQYLYKRLQQAKAMVAQATDPCARIAHLAMMRGYQRRLTLLQLPESPATLIKIPMVPPVFAVAHRVAASHVS
jgi:hypothetical protein